MSIPNSGSFKFLGASVVNFNCNLGWNSSPSTLSCTLAEDPRDNDNFQEVAPGTPQVFYVSGTSQNPFVFRGIVTNWKHNRSSSGFTYSVTMEDPRSILEGVTLLLTNYTGVTNTVPNLVNVFAFYENVSFGSSRSNDNGMPWKKVRDAAKILINELATGTPPTTYPQYGGKIRFTTTSYTINLDALPNIPDDYRIGGDSISLMEFISEVCEVGSCDYFFTLGVGNVITLNVADRKVQPTFGAISSLINSLNGVVSTENGFELRNETVSKFVVGAPRQDIYFQDYRPFVSGDYTDDTIWPYWGTVPANYPGMGNVLVGTNINDEHFVTVDARAINLNYPGVVVDTYGFCVGELRAALESQGAWEHYLWGRNEENPALSGASPTAANYYKRADKLNLIGNSNFRFLSNIQSDSLGDKSFVMSEQGNTAKKQMTYSSISWGTEQEEKIKRLYDFVRGYASEYYGSQFMVRIPQTQSAYDSDLNITKWSSEPTQFGYLDEPSWSGAVYYNYLPPDVNQLLNEEGQIQAYARYDDAAYLDFTDLSSSDVIFNSGGYSAFVKCDVGQGVYYINRQAQFSPRAVIKTAGPVRQRIVGSGTGFGQQMFGIMDKISAAPNSGLPMDDVKRRKVWSQFGSDMINYGNRGMIVQPNMVAVPLLSNTLRYGPWSNTPPSSYGKTEFEVDNTLNPWAFGGYTSMNLAGSGKVSQAYSTFQESETGSVEFPGIPDVELGAQLAGSGPYITDIQVNIDTQAGFTTRYILSTWTPRLGTQSKLQNERIRKIAKRQQQQRALNRQVIRKFEQAKPKKDANGIIIRDDKTQRKQPKSSHGFIVGENILLGVNSSGNNRGTKTGSFIQPAYLTTAQLHPDEYSQKAAATLDVLFRPFSTRANFPMGSGIPLYSGINLPHYNTPVSGAEEPSLYNLNPYTSGFDFTALTRGTEYPEDLNISDGGYDPNGDYRSMGLRFPMVGVGWGYDTDGKPVPNLADPYLNSGLYAASGLQDAFWPDYLKDARSWKAAPVDIRYDYDRQVWVAGGSNNTKIVKLLDISTLPNFPSGFSSYSSGYPTFPTHPGKNTYYAQEYTPFFQDRVGEEISGSGVTLTATSNYYWVGNFRSNLALVNSYYIANKINGKYYLDNQSVFLGDM